MTELLRWNIRGLQASSEELILLLSSLKPHIIALRETKIHCTLESSCLRTFKRIKHTAEPHWVHNDQHHHVWPQASLSTVLFVISPWPCAHRSATFSTLRRSV